MDLFHICLTNRSKKIPKDIRDRHDHCVGELVVIQIFIDDFMDLIIAEAILLPLSEVLVSFFLQFVLIGGFQLQLFVEFSELILLGVMKEQHRSRFMFYIL